MFKAKNKTKRNKIEDIPLLPSMEEKIEKLAQTLSKQIDEEIFKKKYAPVAEVLKLVGAGAFIAASFTAPNLSRVLKPFYSDSAEYEIWKRFNIPYLKRTLKRLEKQKLVEIKEKDQKQVVVITNRGRKKILKYALEEIKIKKPKEWDRKWRLVCYDIPRKLSKLRNVFRDYLEWWGFYQFQESVFIHAYPCEQEVEFLKEYLGIGEYVRIIQATKIENDKPFKDFFGV